MSAVVASQVAIDKSRKASRYFTPTPLCFPRAGPAVPGITLGRLLMSI
jgi:hypothetical protein